MCTRRPQNLAAQLGELYPEQQLYRIDHYLGKEVTQARLERS